MGNLRVPEFRQASTPQSSMPRTTTCLPWPVASRFVSARSALRAGEVAGLEVAGLLILVFVLTCLDGGHGQDRGSAVKVVDAWCRGAGVSPAPSATP